MTVSCFFSIIVPVYNTSQYLPRCLDSILNQTVLSWECILIDDGSTDGSSDICDEYCLKDQRFKVIHKSNEGVSVARNLALTKACGEYIVFLDSDDWLKKDMLQKVSENIKFKKTEMILIGIAAFDGDKIFASYVSDCDLIELDGVGVFPEWYNAPVSKVYKRHFLIDNGIVFPEKISLAEDMVFSYLCFSKIDCLPCIQQVLYFYHVNRQGSACNTIDLKKIQDEITAINLLQEKLSSDKAVFTNSLIQRKIAAKMKLLFSLPTPQPRLFREIFPEVNHFIWNNNKTLFFYCVFHKFDLFIFVVFKFKKVFRQMKNFLKKWSYNT